MLQYRARLSILRTGTRMSSTSSRPTYPTNLCKTTMCKDTQISLCPSRRTSCRHLAMLTLTHTGTPIHTHSKSLRKPHPKHPHPLLLLLPPPAQPSSLNPSLSQRLPLKLSKRNSLQRRPRRPVTRQRLSILKLIKS